MLMQGQQWWNGRLVAEDGEEKICDLTHKVYNRMYKFD